MTLNAPSALAGGKGKKTVTLPCSKEQGTKEGIWHDNKRGLMLDNDVTKPLVFSFFLLSHLASLFINIS